ncbi:MAG: two-component system response regulator [Planctomycetota bacterium]|nr:MAG: two-component system response regulator [Planctomycetota bacterium]
MASKRTTVLVVEEEPTLLDIVAFRLELLGFEVIAKSTADGALAWLADRVPDLVAVGYLADVASVEFLNRLRDDARMSEVPVLFLSANSDLDEVQRAYNAGANEYLLTPFDPLVFEKKIHTLLSLPRAQAAK